MSPRSTSARSSETCPCEREDDMQPRIHERELLSEFSIDTAAMNPCTEVGAPDLLVFSHLRWHFVTQRPQHLLTRAAHSRHVYFWEEPRGVSLRR